MKRNDIVGVQTYFNYLHSEERLNNLIECTKQYRDSDLRVLTLHFKSKDCANIPVDDKLVIPTTQKLWHKPSGFAWATKKLAAEGYEKFILLDADVDWGGWQTIGEDCSRKLDSHDIVHCSEQVFCETNRSWYDSPIVSKRGGVEGGGYAYNQRSLPLVTDILNNCFVGGENRCVLFRLQKQYMEEQNHPLITVLNSNTSFSINLKEKVQTLAASDLQYGFMQGKTARLLPHGTVVKRQRAFGRRYDILLESQLSHEEITRESSGALFIKNQEFYRLWLETLALRE